MHVVHLTASTMFGGPERQMLGLAEHLSDEFRTTFLSFREGGRCGAFLDVVRERGVTGVELTSDFPRLRSTVRELAERLGELKADVLLAHGYKANILGRIAARRAGIPIVAVSRGWTGENWKVRQYERLDRFHLRFVDRVVAVSDAQAAKVLATGVPAERVTVIRNSARLAAFANPVAVEAGVLRAYFPADQTVSQIVLSAGRLSPEKGFDLLVEAAASVLEKQPTAGFIHFGDGMERTKIEAAIRERNLGQRFVLAGFTEKLDRLLPTADLVVLPSHTEGMPNVLLEAGAAGVAAVATRVGGTPEVVVDGETGLLVPPGRPSELATAITALLADDTRRAAMGRAARLRMYEQFSFDSQAKSYGRLLAALQTEPEAERCPQPFSNDLPLSVPQYATVPSGSVSSSTT